MKIELNRNFYGEKTLSYKKSFKGKNNSNYKHGKTLIRIKCIDCGKELSKNAYYCRYKRCKKCSYRQHSKKMSGKKSNFYIDGRKTKKYFCIICGNKICYTTWMIGNKTCRKCSKIGHKCSENTKKKMSLKAGGNGIPYDYSEYGSKFDSSLKEQVRMRDKYKCRLCNCSQIENGRQLDVHHIDYNKKNNNENNLIVLCRSCHAKTKINRKYWRKYFNDKLNLSNKK